VCGKGHIYAVLSRMSEIALASSVNYSVKYFPQFAGKLQNCKVLNSGFNRLMSVTMVRGSVIMP
jgi:hypothetical protein